jgi:hypothetical protein
MRTLRKPHHGWLIAGLMLLSPAMTAIAQRRLPTSTGVPPPTGTGASTNSGATDSARTPDINGMGLGLPADSTDSTVGRNMAAIRSNLLNTERQRVLTIETEQLLRMTAELQVKIASNTAGLSNDEILKRIDTIEKLARNVKQRMKGAR